MFCIFLFCYGCNGFLLLGLKYLQHPPLTSQSSQSQVFSVKSLFVVATACKRTQLKKKKKKNGMICMWGQISKGRCLKTISGSNSTMPIESCVTKINRSLLKWAQQYADKSMDMIFYWKERHTKYLNRTWMASGADFCLGSLQYIAIEWTNFRRAILKWQTMINIASPL